MRRLVFVLVLLPLLFPSRATGAACAPQQVAVLDAANAGSNLLVLQANFSGRFAPVLVDTGSDWSLMDAGLVSELGLRPKRLPRPYLDVSGGRIDRYVTVSRFEVGPLVFAGGFVVAPAGEAPALYAATLGARMLSGFDVEIDGRTRRVAFYRAKGECAGPPAHWAHKGRAIPFVSRHEIPEIEAVVDGRTMRAVFDTGASRTLMDLGAARRLFGLTPQSPGVVPHGTHRLPSGARRPFYAYTFSRLSFAGLAFDDVEILLGDFPVVPLTLGMSEIDELHVYIAFKRRVIRATRAQAPR